MEHLLVSGEGAGAAIAFGRSRIAYLKTLNLAYVSQTFVIGDWQVRVKITPGHEYIFATGGCAMAVDSGVLDLRSSIPWFAEFALPGLRKPTVVTRRNEAAMNKLIAGDSKDDSKPDLLTGPGIAGRAVWGEKRKGDATKPGEVARSLMPVVVRENAADPNSAWRFSKNDENLITKKLTVMSCPASLFTGRCREWVQAVYGRFLYRDWHKGDTAVMPLSLNAQPGTSPALNAAFHETGRSKAPTPQARIYTSAGVHRDAQGRHWLFIPGLTDDVVDVFQLRSSECGESLRKALGANPPKWASEMSNADRDVLELYILAYSLPVQDTWQRITAPRVKHSADAMGYGWHWNKTGLLADRVINSQFKQGSKNVNGQDNWAMRSTHERLTMTFAAGKWAAAASTVSGPYDWAVQRGLCVVLEPYWGEEGGSWKTTPFYTELFAYSGATFYVWYRGDELQMASITLARVEEQAAQTQCEPPDFELFTTDPATGYVSGWSRGKTVGARGGWAEIVQKIPAYWQYTIDVAGKSFSMNPGRMEQGRWFSVSGKSEALDLAPSTPTGNPSTDTSSWSYGLTYESYYEGYPPWTYYQRQREGNERIAGMSARRIVFTYDRDIFAFTRNYPGKVVIAVPRMDAEAMYVRGDSARSQVNAAYTRGQNASRNYAHVSIFAFAYNSGGYSVGPPHIQYLEGEMENDGPAGPGTPIPSQTIRTELGFVSHITTRCPDVSATNADWDLSPKVWMTDEDIVPETFYTLTSSMGEVALIAQKFGQSVGVDLLPPNNAAIVGVT